MTSSKQNTGKPHLLVGYTTSQHLLLDLDKTTLTQARHITKLIQESYPEVGDALIMESSPPHKKDRLHYQHHGSIIKIPLRPNHHVIFDGIIGYKKCVKIITALVDLNVLPEEYRNIREWRGDMTLRVSPKPLTDRTVPAPKILGTQPSHHAYANHGGIKAYILYQTLAPLLFAADLEAETEPDQRSDSADDSAQHDTIFLVD